MTSKKMILVGSTKQRQLLSPVVVAPSSLLLSLIAMMLMSGSILILGCHAAFFMPTGRGRLGCVKTVSRCDVFGNNGCCNLIRASGEDDNNSLLRLEGKKSSLAVLFMANNSNDIDKVGSAVVSSVMDNLPNFGIDGIASILSQKSKAADEAVDLQSQSSAVVALPSRPKLTPAPPSPPLPPFDPTNPEALISITKSFIATDFGIQSRQLSDYSTAPPPSKKKKTGGGTGGVFGSRNDVNNPSAESALPYYSSSLLSSQSFVWISGSNVNDGRTGVLTKGEYLAAGRYFDLRGSFPDLEYRAHDFRVVYDEGADAPLEENVVAAEGGSITPIERLNKGTTAAAAASAGGGGRGGEITVRFTTLVTGTFRGAPLRLRSVTLEPNGRVMRCPPTR